MRILLPSEGVILWSVFLVIPFQNLWHFKLNVGLQKTGFPGICLHDEKLPHFGFFNSTHTETYDHSADNSTLLRTKLKIPNADNFSYLICLI